LTTGARPSPVTRRKTRKELNHADHDTR
jgi:hypothetical protein